MTDRIDKPVSVTDISLTLGSPSFARDIAKSRAPLRTLEKLVNKVKLLIHKQLRERRLC